MLLFGFGVLQKLTVLEKIKSHNHTSFISTELIF